MVDDGDAALLVDPDTAGMRELPLVVGVVGVSYVPLPDHVRVGVQLVLAPLGQGGVAGELGDEAPVGSEDLHPVVHPVCDVDVAIGVNSHAVRPAELADSGAALADGLLPLAGAVEDLDAVVPPVGDVDVVLAVQSYAPRHVELAIAASLGAEAADELTVEGELLHTAVLAVDNDHLVLGVYGQAGGAVEFAVAGTGGPPLADVIAIGGELGDAVEPLVGDVYVAGAVQGHSGGPDELSVALTVLAESADVFLVQGDHGHVDAVRTVLVGTVYDIHRAVLGNSHVHRVAEAGAGKFIPADGMAMVKRPVFQTEEMCCHILTSFA